MYQARIQHVTNDRKSVVILDYDLTVLIYKSFLAYFFLIVV